MNRRIRRLLLAAAIACLALAGCGGDDDASDAEPLSGEGFKRALEAVRDQVGEDASLLRIQVTGGGAEFYLVGEETRGFVYANGELTETDFQVIGAGALSERAFPLGEVEPEVIERLIDGASDEAGEELAPVAVTLERSPLDGELRWTLNAAGGVAYRAGPDGSEPVPGADAPEQGL